MLDAVFSALLVAVVTALVTAILTSWVSARVLDERMKDFKERIKRIEDLSLIHI